MSLLSRVQACLHAAYRRESSRQCTYLSWHHQHSKDVSRSNQAEPACPESLPTECDHVQRNPLQRCISFWSRTRCHSRTSYQLAAEHTCCSSPCLPKHSPDSPEDGLCRTTGEAAAPKAGRAGGGMKLGQSRKGAADFLESLRAEGENVQVPTLHRADTGSSQAENSVLEDLCWLERSPRQQQPQGRGRLPGIPACRGRKPAGAALA